MQPLTKHREVLCEGVTESRETTIKEKNARHLKAVLRDSLYSDKVLAVLREYSANAWDAHRMVGKHDLPIEVTLPTWQKPTLIIKDFGPGLSHEDVFDKLGSYGESTKRGSNDEVGTFGIGAKSGWAYSDTYTIISRHGGKARTYVALLDEDENDSLNLLSEEDCGEDTGLTIQIAVRNEDIFEFERKAQGLFQHFNPRPTINTYLPPVPEIAARLQHGIIYDREIADGGQWFAVMGCIPYRVNLDQLKDAKGNLLVSESFKRTAGLLYLDIGEVQINASREALKYGKYTNEVLVRKFELLLEEFVTTTLEMLEEGSTNSWEKRLKAQTLLRLGLGRKECGEWGAGSVLLEGFKSFTISASDKASISVKEATRFIRMTDIGKRALTGFKLGYHDHLIVPCQIIDDTTKLPIGTESWDTVNAELEKICQDAKVDGISVVDLHTLPWVPKNPRRRYQTTPNAKHQVSTFRLTGTDEDITGGRKLSDNWEIEDRTPTSDDVFVVISRFETSGYSIYQQRRVDQAVAEHFGITLPEIYGYKATEKKPVDPTKTIGTHYPEWRKKFYANLPQDKLKKLREVQAWAKVLPDQWNIPRFHQTGVKAVQERLGKDHPVSFYLTQALTYRAQGLPANQKLIKRLREAGAFQKLSSSTARRTIKQINRKYPLLTEHQLYGLFGDRRDAWLQYIELIDAAIPPEKVED